MTIITIEKIELKEKRSVIITTEGRRLGVWSDKMGPLNLKVGGTFEVETTEKTVDGRTLTNIVQAKAVAGPTKVAKNIPQNIPSEALSPTAHCKDEQIFVLAILKSGIESGKVEFEKQALWSATQMLRGLWKHTFAFDQANEAGRHAA